MDGQSRWQVSDEGMIWRAICLMLGVGCGQVWSPMPSHVVELRDIVLFFLAGWMGFCGGTYLELRVIRRIRYDTLGFGFFQAGVVVVTVAIVSWIVSGWMVGKGGGGNRMSVCIGLGTMAAGTLPFGGAILSGRGEQRKEAERTLEAFSLLGNGVVLAGVALWAPAMGGSGGAGSWGETLAGAGIGCITGLILDRAGRTRRGPAEGIGLGVGILSVAFGLGARWGIGAFPIGAVAGVWLINASSRRQDVLEDVGRLRGLAEGGLLVLVGTTLQRDMVLFWWGIGGLSLGLGLSLCRWAGRAMGVRGGRGIFSHVEIGEQGAAERALVPQGGLAAAAAYALGFRGRVLGVLLWSIVLNLGMGWLLKSGRRETERPEDSQGGRETEARA